MKKNKLFYILTLMPFLVACNPPASPGEQTQQETPVGPTVVKCESVTADYDEITLELSKHYKVGFTISPSNASDQRVTYQSGDESICTLTSKGLIEAKAIGTTNVTVKTKEGEKTDTIVVNVVAHTPKDEPLVIPTVDFENLTLDLPTRPTYTYNQSDIKTDATYDYINFYEVSDFHGATKYEVGSDSVNLGLSKMATYFETLRNDNPGGTVLLSTGDMYQGSVESNSTRGYLVNYAMNYMGFDAMAVGNHEFDWSPEWIKKNAVLSYDGYSIPFLGANIIDNNTNQIPTYLKSSTIINRGDYKIGIIGTMGNGLESSILKTSIENITFENELTVAKQEAQYLKNTEDCDIVVWLSHNSVENLLKYDVGKSDGIDAIFGGHAHVSDFDYQSLGIPVAASANYGRAIASIQLKINKNTKEVSNKYTTVIDTTSIETPDDSLGINQIYNNYQESFDTISNIKLGYCYEELSNDFLGELKNVCVDAMQTSAKKYCASTSGTDAIDPDDVVYGFHNVSGGIRSNISAGEITYGDIYTPFPFDNELVLLKLKRSQFTSIKNDYWVFWKSYEKASELSAEKDYYVVTTDFLALSKLHGFSDDDLIHTGLNVRDEIAKFIYDENQIDPHKYTNNYHFM